MSRTPYFYIEKFNEKENKWEEVTLWRLDYYGEEKDKKVKVDVWPFNGSHDLFEILTDGSIDAVHRRIPSGVSADIKEEIEFFQKDWIGWYPYYVNLADLKLYYIEHPKERDWEGEDENATVDSPLRALIDRVISVIDLSEFYWNSDSEFRIIYWIT